MSFVWILLKHYADVYLRGIILRECNYTLQTPAVLSVPALRALRLH